VFRFSLNLKEKYVLTDFNIWKDSTEWMIRNYAVSPCIIHSFHFQGKAQKVAFHMCYVSDVTSTQNKHRLVMGQTL